MGIVRVYSYISFFYEHVVGKKMILTFTVWAHDFVHVFLFSVLFLEVVFDKWLLPCPSVLAHSLTQTMSTFDSQSVNWPLHLHVAFPFNTASFVDRSPLTQPTAEEAPLPSLTHLDDVHHWLLAISQLTNRLVSVSALCTTPPRSQHNSKVIYFCIWSLIFVFT